MILPGPRKQRKLYMYDDEWKSLNRLSQRLGFRSVNRFFLAVSHAVHTSDATKQPPFLATFRRMLFPEE
jgi:hypothetical protein